jgi:hypothetical protein
MERVMSLGAVPDGDEMYLRDLGAGQQLLAASGVPVAWVTDWAFPGPYWADLAYKAAKSGLRPRQRFVRYHDFDLVAQQRYSIPPCI